MVVILFLLALVGCNGCKRTKSRPKPDVSNVQVKLQWLDFSSDFEKYPQPSFEQWRSGMRARYADFYDFYISEMVIGPRPVGDTADIEKQAIESFLTDSYVKKIQEGIHREFADTKDVQADLTQSFRYFKYYFPQFKEPQIIAFNSLYQAGVSPFGKDKFVIGLDMFLGSNNSDYDSAGVYAYIRHKMRREYIARYTIEALYNDYFYTEPDNQNLIEAITERGKEIYFLSMLFPDAPDSLLLGYTQAQTDWCMGSEKSIWQFMNDKDLLYKSNAMDKTRYLSEGPTTSGMPVDAPGNIGNFIGWQIVKKYMENNGSKLSLSDFILKHDAASIFAKAKYRPQ